MLPTRRHEVSATRVLLLRHGQSTWNADGRWQGQEDPPLSATGERQAVEAAARLDGIDAMWASDLVRARRTAEILAADHRLAVSVDAQASASATPEPWQGRTRAEIDAEWPGYLAEQRRPEGYEPDEDLLVRVLAALDAIADAHPGAAVAVVSHGGIVGTVERHLGDPRDGPIPNLSGRWPARGTATAGGISATRSCCWARALVTVPGQI